MKKRIRAAALLTALSAVSLVFSVEGYAYSEPLTETAQYDAVYDDAEPAETIPGSWHGNYKFDKSTQTITDVNSTIKGDNGYIEVPFEIDSTDVKAIGSKAFAECNMLTSIKIPGSIETIEAGAFSGLGNLTSVIIENGVKTIGASAFYNCNTLQKIELPDSVTYVGKSAFGLCKSASSLTLSKNLKVIEKSTFQACHAITSVSLPYGLTEIGEMAFNKCDAMTSINIPTSVIKISNGAFWACTELTSVSIEDGVKDIGNNAFRGCSSLANIVLPNSVRTIGDYTFGDNDSLTEMIIPEGVTTIGSRVFINNKNMKSVTLPDSVEKIGTKIFWNCPDTAVIYGHSSAYAHTYAKNNNYIYIPTDQYISGTARKENNTKLKLTISANTGSVPSGGIFVQMNGADILNVSTANIGSDGTVTIDLADGTTYVKLLNWQNLESMIPNEKPAYFVISE